MLVYNDKFELYDRNLNLIKTISGIDDWKVRCCKAITNEKNLIYMCEYNSHKLRVINYQFNDLLLTVPSATKLYYPFDMCYYSGFVFVCDLRNRIVKFKEASECLDFVYDQIFDFQIRQILVNSNYLCVNTINFNRIYFLNLNNFEIIKCYESPGGPICELGSYFYEFRGKYGEFITCYDFDGCFVETVNTRFSNKHITFNYNVCIKKFFDKIVITTSCGKLLSI